MKNGFCIVVSKSKLHQCVALCRSIINKVKDPKSYSIFVLCMDETAFTILNRLELVNATLIQLQDVETDELRVVKSAREVREYCWTLKPVLLEYVLNKYPEIDRVTHLDADLYVFSDLSPVFTNQSHCSVLLSDHDFTDQYKGLERDVGKANSGIVSFKRDKYGLECLKWWKERCLEWCNGWVDGEKFSDQKYLSTVADLFPGVEYIHMPGVNIAPWNEKKHNIALRKKKVYIDNSRLIIYHFCSFHMRSKSEYYIVFNGDELNPIIYEPYVQMMGQVLSDIEKIDPTFNIFSGK